MQETAMKCVRSADGAFMHRVDLAEVDLAVQEHAQLFVAWRARHHAGHRVTVFAQNPQRFGFWTFRHVISPELDGGRETVGGRPVQG